MLLWRLLLQSLRNRTLTTVLTIASIGLSVFLLLGVEQLRRATRTSFQGTISQTDLIVGGRTGPVQLLLYTVFHMGSPTTNIKYETFEKFQRHKHVRWAIPISLGDGHRGFRVVATDYNFYKYFRFHGENKVEFTEGKTPLAIFDIAIGSEVARKLNYKLNQKVVVAHGMAAAGLMDHDTTPFRVVGILKPTHTPIDNTLLISLEGMEAIHVDWHSGAPPMPGEESSAAEIQNMDLRPHQITAFFLGTKSRVRTLGLQREINEYNAEPLMAILPAVTLGEMWRTIAYAEKALLGISGIVVLVGLVGMLMSIYTSLENRRREMAILRVLGAHPYQIIILFLGESTLLSLAGALSGLGLLYALLFFLGPLLENTLGLHIPILAPGLLEILYLLGVPVAGTLLGLIPGLRAYKQSLSDGLTIKI